MAKTALKLNTSQLEGDRFGDCVRVGYIDCILRSLKWANDTQDVYLRAVAKRHGGVFERDKGWIFSDTQGAQKTLNTIIRRHRDWPIIGNPNKPHMALARFRFSRLQLEETREALLIRLPMPPFSIIKFDKEVITSFLILDAKKEVALLLGSAAHISTIRESLVVQGAICDDSLAMKWGLTTLDSKVQVQVKGWAVQITFDLLNPRHYVALPQEKYVDMGVYGYAHRGGSPWNGQINITRKSWAIEKEKILANRLAWEGDDPDNELAISTAFDASRVPGWDTPAPNGHLLHAYQKIGAQFCASHAMHALIGDEMGVGKTAQAIAAVEATSTARVLVICPANARYVWEREILGWSGRGAIQHIASQFDKLDLSARWHIVTYDLISPRLQTWRLLDAQEERAFISTFPQMAKLVKGPAHGGYPRQVKIEEALEKPPAFADSTRIDSWEKMMRCLRGALVEQFLSVDNMLTILDEAHRAKNRTSKRTKAIQRIAERGAPMLMLTGTPIRNNEHEAAVLLSLLDRDAAAALSTERGYNIQDVKDCLKYFMIRRTKAEVLPELPPKTRQRIDIDTLDQEAMQNYQGALDWAYECRLRALSSGKSEAVARQRMMGGLERARIALALAKVRSGEVAELVSDVVESKGCCVVFCAHVDVTDALKVQLENMQLRVAVVDGRTSQKKKLRAELVDNFKNGLFDVLIGSIKAAGEAITLTRADTIIFVELEWVPGALLQAEDRIHRQGQLNNSLVIQLIARLPDGGENLDQMMEAILGAKMATIGAVLDEDQRNVITKDIKGEVITALFQKKDAQSKENVVERPSCLVAPVPSIQVSSTADPAVVISQKRTRGRPRIYVEKTAPTGVERSKKANKRLADSGGKRLMLRLTPQANDALKAIAALNGGMTETAAINEAIISVHGHLGLPARFV